MYKEGKINLKKSSTYQELGQVGLCGRDSGAVS
jgi:hypothetical protein